MRLRAQRLLLALLAGAAGLMCAKGADLKKLGLDQPLDPALRPALEPVPETPGLPRVLLIGDSISIAYTRVVRQELAGRANVLRPPENCGPTVYALERLDDWLGTGQWQVIHFNFGLHDLKYLDVQGRYITPGPTDRPLAEPAVYAVQLERIIGRLRRTGAALIMATTTPVPSGASGRIAGSEREYNRLALAVAGRSGVAVNDLAGLAAAHPEWQRPRNVHFTDEGSAALGRAVAARIAEHLSSSRP